MAVSAACLAASALLWASMACAALSPAVLAAVSAVAASLLACAALSAICAAIDRASPIRPLAVVSASCARLALDAAAACDASAFAAASAAFALSCPATPSLAFAACAELSARVTLSSIDSIWSRADWAARVTVSHAATVSELWSSVAGSTSTSPAYSTVWAESGTST